MSFLNPALLAFGAAVAVPILIHLLNRRRFRQVSWAAMRFVRASVEKNRRRMQIEDLILLVLRCLIVGLFALALARPALRSAVSALGTRRVTAAVVLDHSASLGAGDGTRVRFDLARQAAEEAVDALPAGSAVAVFLAGDRVSAPLPEPSQDLNQVRKTLREAPLSDLATDHSVGVMAALEALGAQAALRKEIILVTDRQASGWRRLPELAAALREAARDTRLRVLFVGEPLEDNLAVSALARSSGFVPARESIRFDAEIANRGATAVREVRATLHLGGGPAIDDVVLEVLGPGEVRRVTFYARLPAEGFHAVTVRLPPDRLPADDERTIVVEAVKEVRVLVVEGDPAGNAAFFLRNALQPVPPEVAPQYFLQPQVASPAQLGLARLGEYDTVILADVPPLPASTVDLLARYVRDGGGLLVCPGPQARPEFYNAELGRRAGLLPAFLGPMRGNPEGDEAGFALQGSDYQHPVFALWNEAGAGSLAAARFRAAWELQPAPPPTRAVGTADTPVPAPRVMVRFADGAPAAIEWGMGRGRVMLFASTAGTAWNDLAVRPAFIPLLHRSVAFLADVQEGRFNVRAGARASLREPGELAGRDVSVTIPVTPERQTTQTLRSVPEAALLEFDDTLHAGVYRVALAGSSTLLAQFAVQPDPAESELAELSTERRAEVEQVGQAIDWAPGTDLRAAFDRERVGVELWLPLALGVLLLGVSEVWLAQQFSRPK